MLMVIWLVRAIRLWFAGLMVNNLIVENVQTFSRTVLATLSRYVVKVSLSHARVMLGRLMNFDLDAFEIGQFITCWAIFEFISVPFFAHLWAFYKFDIFVELLLIILIKWTL